MAKRESSTLTDPTRKKPLPEIREDYEYAKSGWAKVREEAADDMQNVAGNPWNADDDEVREGRPTIAPDEMTQYRNQVTNRLRRDPRGMKFQPVGMGASQKTAELYQDKAREIEYRSDAQEHYIRSADDVLQRSYGAFRIGIRYEDARDINPEIYIDGFPDPDVVLPDPDIRREHGQDMKFCFVLDQMRQSDFKAKYKGAQVRNFADYVGRPRFNDWLIGSKMIQIAEYWKLEYTKRTLYAVILAPVNTPPEALGQIKPMALFEDEIERAVASGKVRVISQRTVREVDYPKVVMRVTNGLEILETKDDWPGRYIPIVLLFGPTLYVKEGGETKRKVLSMTRTMKVPWKAFCYASSQELEVLGQVPKAAAVAYAGQLAGFEEDWEESLHRPKAVLYALERTPGMVEGEERLPLPQRLEYAQGEYLQAIEVVKEGYRRSIQAAAGSNFLPTQAQRMNEKSGVALDKMDDAATQGTYHVDKTYESAVQWGGTIIEDLFDKVYDFEGETSVINAKKESRTVRINQPDDEQAYPTRGQHLVTVQTMPSSDSEYDAVEKFIDLMVGNLQIIANISGPQSAAYVFATSIKMRNLGVMGDELADALMPPAFKQQDGKPPDPRLAQAMGQVQKLTQELQKAQFEIETGAVKEKIKGALQMQITQLKAAATSADKDKDRAVKLDVAAIEAKIETMAMVLQELERLGGLHENRAQRMLDAHSDAAEKVHNVAERAKDRLHEHLQGGLEHARAIELASHTAALQPTTVVGPEAGV